MAHTLFALFDFKINHTVSIDGFINAALTMVLTLIGWGLRKIYTSITNFFTHIQSMDDRQEDAMQVVDLHSHILRRNGLAKNIDMPRLSQRRRSSDRPEQASV